MNDLLMYFLKVNIAIALFYLFYRLAFYNDTFWATRRFYLVFSILLAIIYPFISVSGWLERQEPMQAIMASYVQLNVVTVTVAPVSVMTLENLLLAAYGIISCSLLIKMVVQLVSILRWRLKGKKVWVNGVEIIAIDATITPFSFFTTIFMNPALHNEQETGQILTHERTHARQWHSLDVILSELMTILFWINPATWLLKREIRHNLEFLADNSVLQSGIDSTEYQYHLLELSYQNPENLLINKFNVSPLKKRITMMNHKKTKKAGILKYALIVPMALALVLSSNAETLVNKTRDLITPKEVVDKTTEKIMSVKDTETTANDLKVQVNPTDSQPENSKAAIEKSDNNRIYAVVEKMPEYPGGMQKLFAYLVSNINYPDEARKNGVQGEVIVRFIVNQLGEIAGTQVLKGVNPEIDNEVIRVINSMPAWTPGEQKGKKIDVYYTLPIQLALNNGNPSVASNANGHFYKSSIRNTMTVKYDGKTPLFIVDGKEISKSDFKKINPNDYQPVNILKREAGIKAYGDKGKNGVYELTKKK
jgi:TonB family protein